MNTELITECETLWRTAERLQRAGLIVDPQAFSRAHRRAHFALQCQLQCQFAAEPEPAASEQPLLGFAYPTAC